MSSPDCRCHGEASLLWKKDARCFQGQLSEISQSRAISGRQWLAVPGAHPARPWTRGYGHHNVRLRERPCRCIAAVSIRLGDGAALICDFVYIADHWDEVVIDGIEVSVHGITAPTMEELFFRALIDQ
jgi:hypothetical protein